MCSVCKDPECHWGEYCYPSGQSSRLRRLKEKEEAVMRDALRKSVRLVAKGRRLTETG